MKAKTSLGRTVLLVKDYEEAFQFYQSNFHCRKIFDTTNASGQRFLHIGFNDTSNTGLWLLKSPDHAGKQTGGEPFLIIYTDDISSLYDHLHANGVKITSRLVEDHAYSYFHCLDLYGNELVVVELSEAEK